MAAGDVRDPNGVLTDGARLDALGEAELLGTGPEDSFDRLTRLASQLLKAPLSQINLLNDRLLYSKSSITPAGWPTATTLPLEESLCRFAVIGGDSFVVRDSRSDPRLAADPLASSVGLLAYAGTPLVTPEGHSLGTLCVGDTQPRAWSDEELGLLRDLAALVTTEIELRRERRRHASGREQFEENLGALSALLTHLPGAAYRRRNEPDWSVEVISEGVTELTGHTPEEFTSGQVRLAELIHPEDADRVWAAVQQGVAERRPFAVEYRIRTRTGEEKWLWEQGMGVFSATGELEALEGFIEDATERKRSEEALRRSAETLRESESRFRQLTESISDVFWLSEVGTGRILYISPAYETVWGRDAETLYAHPETWVEAMHEDDLAYLMASFEPERIAAGGFDGEVRIRRPDGEIRWIHCRAFPLRDEKGELYRIAGVSTDITERKKIEEALLAAKDEAERADRAKSEFLSRMSHELRTPLNAILGFGQLLEGDSRVADQESVEHILRAGRHLLTLVDEVLDLAKIDADRLTLSIELVPVEEVVRECLNLVRLMAAQAGVTLEPEEGCACAVAADRQRLKQVLLNLLSNAIKYNRPGGSVRVVCTGAPGALVRIAVTDTGRGIAPERIDRLFTPFERLGADQTEIDGTGLGLALSKAFTVAMGGHLGVESVEGEGSTFWIEVPRLIPPSAPPDREQTDPGDGVHTDTILYIEDSLTNLRLVERVLANRPRTVLTTAMLGGVGLDLARETRPSLILLDLDLPDMRGERVLERLRQDPDTRSIPVLAISADSNPGVVERLLASGARSYITKPIDVREFLAAIDDALQDGAG